MLVLARKVNEVLLIGDEVLVTVLRIGPNSVRLGIEAPAHMDIVRQEIVSLAEIGCGDCREDLLDCKCVFADA